MQRWSAGPLERVYAAVFIDVIMVSCVTVALFAIVAIANALIRPLLSRQP